MSDRAAAAPSLDACERLFAAVELWREIHRVLVAGGIGTADRCRLCDADTWLRVGRRLAPGGVEIRRALYIEDDAPADEPATRAIARALRRAIPPLRERLHVEVELARKSRGIAIEPAWDSGES